VQQFLRTNISSATPKEQKLLRLLVGDKSVPAQLVSSNLRRAVSTMLIDFSACNITIPTTMRAAPSRPGYYGYYGLAADDQYNYYGLQRFYPMYDD
jgi:hypothetical protein